MLVFPFLSLEQPTTFKDSMIDQLSNLINRNRSAAKISQVLCSDENGSIPFLFGISKITRQFYVTKEWQNKCLFHTFL